MKNLLTIAGSDSCGGAGIQADLKTFSALGTYGMSVITAVTAQNTLGVRSVRELDLQIIKEQLDAVFEDIRVDAVKVGMVSSVGIIDTIGEALHRHGANYVVVDPVMVSKSGCQLLKPEAQKELVRVLFPLATVVTPNLFEAEVITGDRITNLEEMRVAARKICSLGAQQVIVKGGHLIGEAVDLFFDGKEDHCLKGTRINTNNTHGTGCTFSSAIAAFLGRGYDLSEAVRLAKVYISGAIEHSVTLGHGVGPTNHFYDLYRRAGVNIE